MKYSDYLLTEAAKKLTAPDVIKWFKSQGAKVNDADITEKGSKIEIDVIGSVSTRDKYNDIIDKIVGGAEFGGVKYKYAVKLPKEAYYSYNSSGKTFEMRFIVELEDINESPKIEQSLSTSEAEDLKKQVKKDLELLNFDGAGELNIQSANSKWITFIAKGATATLDKIEDEFYKFFTDTYKVKRLLVELDNFKAVKRGKDVEIEADYFVKSAKSKSIKESFGGGDKSHYLLILTKYSTDLKKNLKQYLVWTKKDLQTYEPKAYGSTMDAAIATFNKVREDREEEEYIESLGAIDCDKRYASKVCDTLTKAKADIIKISPEVKKALESGLTEAKKVYYLLHKRRTNDQLGKSFYKFMVWTLSDLKSYSNRAKGASMERAVNAYNNSANAYIEIIGEVSGVSEPVESSDKTDIASAKSEIISKCPAVKSMVQNVRESLQEGEFIPVKDWEAKQKKLNPTKEAKLKKALAVVDSKREAVNKFMKSYDASDEKQRIERAKLGAELAAAMSAYLEIL